MDINKEDKAIMDDAIKFAKKNKKKIALKLTDINIFTPEETPVSVFMAGSPGAGKTEASIELLNALRNDNSEILRIDLDELRKFFENYNGKNAYLFHGAASILMEKVLDLAFKNGQSFILDGTLSKYDIAKKNIERSLKKKRYVDILYVYQDPILAWEFVESREKTDGRRILKENFIEQYFEARNVVNRLKKKYKKQIEVSLLIKNINGKDQRYGANIDEIDKHVPEKYTKIELERIL